MANSTVEYVELGGNANSADNDGQMPTIQSQKPKTSARQLKFAIGLMLLSAVAYSFLGVVVKWANILGFSSFEAIIFRSTFQIMVSSLSSFVVCGKAATASPQVSNPTDIELEDMNGSKRSSATHSSSSSSSIRCVCTEFCEQIKNMPRKLWTIVVVRSLFSASMIICYFESLAHIDIGDAVAILSMYPIFVSFVAFFVLKEKLTVTHGVALVFCVVGLMFIAQPEFIFAKLHNYDPHLTRHDANPDFDPKEEILGYFLAIGASLLMCGSIVFVKLAKEAPSSFILLAQGITCLIEGIILTAVLASFVGLYKWQDYVALIAVALVGYLAQWTLTVAIKLLPAGLSSLIRSSEIVWAYVWQITIFHSLPSYCTVIGAVIIIAAIGAVSYEKIKKTLKDMKQ